MNVFIRSMRLRILPFLMLGVSFAVLPVFPQPKQITILHTNDMHASFLPREAVWIRTTPRPLVGGFNELAFAVDSVRRTQPPQSCSMAAIS